MAAKTFTLNGICYRRVEPQGRKTQSPELVRVQMSFRADPETQRRVLEQAAKYGMSPSRYMDTACALFDVGQFLSDDNCSKQ